MVVIFTRMKPFKKEYIFRITFYRKLIRLFQKRHSCRACMGLHLSSIEQTNIRQQLREIHCVIESAVYAPRKSTDLAE